MGALVLSLQGSVSFELIMAQVSLVPISPRVTAVSCFTLAEGDCMGALFVVCEHLMRAWLVSNASQPIAVRAAC